MNKPSGTDQYIAQKFNELEAERDHLKVELEEARRGIIHPHETLENAQLKDKLVAAEKERDDFKEKWYASNRNLHAAWKDRDEQLEKLAAQAKELHDLRLFMKNVKSAFPHFFDDDPPAAPEEIHLRSPRCAVPEPNSPEQLRQAVDSAERDSPLPRCEHGRAMRDGAGEILEPPCGCRYFPQPPPPDPAPGIDYRMLTKKSFERLETLRQKVLDEQKLFWELKGMIPKVPLPPQPREKKS